MTRRRPRRPRPAQDFQPGDAVFVHHIPNLALNLPKVWLGRIVTCPVGNWYTPSTLIELERKFGEPLIWVERHATAPVGEIPWYTTPSRVTKATPKAVRVWKLSQRLEGASVDTTP